MELLDQFVRNLHKESVQARALLGSRVTPTIILFPISRVFERATIGQVSGDAGRAERCDCRSEQRAPCVMG